MQYLIDLHVFINMYVQLRVGKQQHHYISLNTCTMFTEAEKTVYCFLLTSQPYKLFPSLPVTEIMLTLFDL